MNQSSQLYQLQKIDTEIDRTTARLAEIARELAMDETVRSAQQALEAAKRKQYKVQQSLRSIEQEVQAVRIKINTSESSLYGGSIRNPKELQDIQSEIASLKKRLAALEDSQLEVMLELDDAESELTGAETALTAAQATHSSQQAGLLGEQSKLQKILDRLQVERGATSGSILPENLEIYERMRKQKRGVAVVAIEDSACAGCGTSIRPAELQVARSPDRMAYCSTCGRILFPG